jgi:site-specific recombinase XerD
MELLSPELAAGIRRVKGAKKVGVRLGNWLTAEQAKALLHAPDIEKVRGKRDHAMLAVLLGCGLRRSVSTDDCMSAFQSTVKFVSVGKTVKETISSAHVLWT